MKEDLKKCVMFDHLQTSFDYIVLNIAGKIGKGNNTLGIYGNANIID